MTRVAAESRLDRIEALARTHEAGNTHGPWVWQGGYPQRITNGAAVLIADCFENPDMPSTVAEFIAAADPQTVLALVTAVRAAQAFESAYVEASVSDEEGLLITVDPAAMRELWQAADQAALRLRSSLAVFQESDE